MNRSKLLNLSLIVLVAVFIYPVIKLSWSGIKLASSAKKTIVSVQDYAQHFFSADDDSQKRQIAQLKTDLSKLNQNLSEFNDRSSRNWLAKKLIADKQALLDLAPELIDATQKILAGSQSYVLLFQNSEELRATGGFLGSYAKIQLQDGKLIDFKIEDIYVPDGQFGWFIEAPTGAKEYLSGGEGLRLRDANWYPDFPTSAQQILTYLAWGKEAGLNGAVAVNLPIVEEILHITGPIYIHDYNQTVTENNFSDVARADRSNFFPGSVQKQHFLNTFFNQLLIKLQNLDQSQQQTLIKTIADNAARKNLQFFSHDQELQLLFEKLNIAGQLNQKEEAAYLMLVESNVGINKANQHLDRAVDLNITNQAQVINVTFANHNFPPDQTQKNPDEANHLGYVNYQRVILSPQVKIKKIIFDNQPIADWNEELITASNGESFKQVGFLLTLAEGKTKKLSIEVENLIDSNQQKIFIQKQAGLNKILYHFSYFGHNSSYDLDRDTLINLN